MSDFAIKVENVSKAYTIWRDPAARLKHPLLDLGGEFFPALRPRIDQKMMGLRTEFYALKDVSFEVRKGESVGIIGRNGSGKSTLLQIIAGTLQPTEGSVTVNGRVAALLELGSGFNPEFTGRENVYLNAAVLGLSREDVNARYDEIVSFADIGNFIEQPVKTYSSGMIVRLAFAVSACIDPDILIVDEALAVGDMAFQFKCLNRLKELTDGGATILFVSHDMGMVKNFCNHVIYLQKGTEKASGTPEEMAELYVLDMRNEQRLSEGLKKGVYLKPALGGDKSMAFGTDEGYILSAAFANTGSTFSSYMQGEEIIIHVEAKVLSGILAPSLSLIIHDRRMMDIGGGFFPIHGGEMGDEWREVGMTIQWPACLAGGRYSITLRLENRAGDRNFQLIDKQVGILAFEVLEEKQTFLGPVDLGIRARQGLRIVALIAVRNEAMYLARCLEHLYQQGIDACIIDNESTDESLDIAKSFLGRGVFRIENQPYHGYFDLTAQLSLKEKLAGEIDADWFIHHDADEIREAPNPYRTLKEGIEAVDRAGYNAINFDEFVFIPTSECESYEGKDYVETMRHYYFFETAPMRRVNAWKKTNQPVHLVASGGHKIEFGGRKIFPASFILRHYIGLSADHLKQKYSTRIYSDTELHERGWFQARQSWRDGKLVLPDESEMKETTNKSDFPDKSTPLLEHIFKFVTQKNS